MIKSPKIEAKKVPGMYIHQAYRISICACMSDMSKYRAPQNVVFLRCTMLTLRWFVRIYYHAYTHNII